MCISSEGTSCWCQEDTQSKQGTTSEPAYYFLQVVKFVGFSLNLLSVNNYLAPPEAASNRQINIPALGCTEVLELEWLFTHKVSTRAPWALQFCTDCGMVNWPQNNRVGRESLDQSLSSYPPPGGPVGIITPQKQQGFGSCFSLWARITLIAKNPLISRLNIFIAVSGSVLVG